jgi:hypothetical protein
VLQVLAGGGGGLGVMVGCKHSICIMLNEKKIKAIGQMALTTAHNKCTQIKIELIRWKFTRYIHYARVLLRLPTCAVIKYIVKVSYMWFLRSEYQNLQNPGNSTLMEWGIKKYQNIIINNLCSMDILPTHTFTSWCHRSSFCVHWRNICDILVLNFGNQQNLFFCICATHCDLKKHS